MIRTIALSALLTAALTSTATADLVISQYFLGNNNSKWIEVFNAGASAINLNNYEVGLWTDANAEGYKTGATPNASAVLNDFTLPSGGVFVMSAENPGNPDHQPPGFENGSVLNFTGNDSFAIYAAGPYSTGALVDAIGFTNASSQAIYVGYVRSSLDQGYSLVPGSNVLNFSDVWQSVTAGEVFPAEPGDDYYLGSTSLSAAVAAIPEPTAALFGSLLAGLLSLTVARRPASRD